MKVGLLGFDVVLSYSSHKNDGVCFAEYAALPTMQALEALEGCKEAVNW